MRKLLMIILILMLFTYIFKQVSFADTSHFEERLAAFKTEYAIKEEK